MQLNRADGKVTLNVTFEVLIKFNIYLNLINMFLKANVWLRALKKISADKTDTNPGFPVEFSIANLVPTCSVTFPRVIRKRRR